MLLHPLAQHFYTPREDVFSMPTVLSTRLIKVTPRDAVGAAPESEAQCIVWRRNDNFWIKCNVRVLPDSDIDDTWAE